MAVQKYSPRVYRRRRINFLLLLIFLFTVTALFYFIHSGFFGFKHLVITGNRHIEAKEVENLMAVSKGTNLWQLDTSNIEKRLKTHPLIADVKINRRWPNTLTVNVKERNPKAIIFNQGNFFLVDGEGVIMQRVEKVGKINLPLITGLDKLKDIGPGSLVNDERLKVALNVVKQISSEDLNQIREIIATSPNSLQFIWAGNIIIKYGDENEVANKMAKIHKALNGLNGTENVEYIDVSFEGPPVIKFSQSSN
ncbi:MAG: cell division protein FtsQ [Clostridia bacterium]|nr:cell division protein FtsQ [Clostridia bacterium]